MKRYLKYAIVTPVIFLAFTCIAYAWQSFASITYSNLYILHNAIEQYKSDYGTFPQDDASSSFYVHLNGLYVEDATFEIDGSGHPLDVWRYRIVYLNPGKHGEFDLHSVGKDGIDQNGMEDDISRWAGVNDGYYWKSTWPTGRLWIKSTIIITLLILLITFRFSWFLRLWLVLPPLLIGISIGSYLLMHPGVVPSRNNPLLLLIAISVIIGLIGLWKSFRHWLNKNIVYKKQEKYRL